MIDTTSTERHVIRSVMLGKGYYDFMGQLKPEFFTTRERREICIIYSKIGQCSLDEAKNASRVEGVYEELTECQSLYAGKDFQRLIDALKEAHMRREIAKAILRCHESLPKLLDPLEEVLSNMMSSIGDVTVKYGVKDERSARPASSIIMPMFSMMEKMYKRDRDSFITMGIPFLDRAFGCTVPGELTIIGARPSIGKSSLAMQMAVNNALHDGKFVLYCSMEMTGESLLARATCSVSGVSFADFSRGLIKKEDMKKFGEGAGVFKNCTNLYIREVPRDKPSAIIAEIKRVQTIEDRKLDMLIIDHIHIAGADGVHRSRIELLTEISGAYKAIAMDYAIPVIALAQLSKSSAKENRPPTLADLRESGSLEQDADRVILLHRVNDSPNREVYEPMEVILAKSRNGQVGAKRALFHGKSTSFVACNENYEPIYDTAEADHESF